MNTAIKKFEFGKSQVLTSERMRSAPKLSRFIFNVFGYTNVGNWARATIVEKLLRQLPLEKFERVMDLGAGLGEFTFMLSEVMPNTRFTAVEILPQRIELLKKSIIKGNYTNVTVHGDFVQTLPENGVFDFIFAVDVFEHIREDDMPFKECYAKLKPGGYFMVKIPNVKQKTILPESWFEDHQAWLEDEHVGQIYNLEGLVNRFKKEGYSIFHASYSDGWFSRLGWEIGFLSKKGGSFVQLALLPFCKLLVHIDRAIFKSDTHGNAIQVIGQKPL